MRDLRFDQLSAPARVVWAKSGEGGGHRLLPHMLDVAAVAEALLKREPAGSMEVVGAGSGSSDRYRLVAAIVGLHDIGKATAGFQAKWPDGHANDVAAGLAFPASALRADAHDLSSARVLRTLLEPKLGNSAPAIALAVAAHHGHFFQSVQLRHAAIPGEPAAWARVREELFTAYWDALLPEFESREMQTGLPGLAWLAGLTSIADWIGSNANWFPPGERGATLPALMMFPARAGMNRHRSRRRDRRDLVFPARAGMNRSPRRAAPPPARCSPRERG